MTLNELMVRLAELQADGHGDLDVVYDYDNFDVKELTVEVEGRLDAPSVININ